MGYKVIKPFTDLQDGNYAYKVGDMFPHLGYTPSDKRLAELSGKGNRQGTPLIQEVADLAEAADEKPNTKRKNK